MKKNKFIFIASLFNVLVLNLTYAQEPTFDWAVRMGGSGLDEGHSITIDDFGNVYTTGEFKDTVDFNPGAGALTFISAGKKDIYIQKLNPLGNLIWAKQIGGTRSDAGEVLTIDSLGYVYISGFFMDTVDFDPGPDTFNLIATGNWYDMFILKLDSFGDLVWAKQIDATSRINVSAITLDSIGNIYTTGWFEGIADFDPGLDTFLLDSPGWIDMFIQKLDKDGNFIWAKVIGGAEYVRSKDIEVDNFGNVFTAGYFTEVADFDPGPDTYIIDVDGFESDSEFFILKLDVNGNFEWVKHIASPYGRSVEGFSMELDDLGNIYTTGWFRGVIDFDPGLDSFYLTNDDPSDVFVLKLDDIGNFEWVKQIDGSDGVRSFSLKLDANNNIYITGLFNGFVDFDPGPEVYQLTAIIPTDLFILKLDAFGDFLWAKRIGAMGTDVGLSLALDNSNNIYTTGYFDGTVDFDPGIDTFNLSSFGGSRDIFVHKLSIPSLSIQKLGNNLSILVYPNPTFNTLEINKGDIPEIRISIFSVSGKIILSKTLDNQFTNLDLSNYSPGVYFMFISDGINSTTQKIVKL